MNNRSYNDSLWLFDNNNEHDSVQFSWYIPLTIGVSLLIGTTFSILSLIRFFRQNNLNTHFNYIYHHMLFFCLFNSVVYAPGFYVGIYLSWFIVSPAFCMIFLIHNYVIFAGLAYLLMWASLERHRFLFQINTTISFFRQMFPLIIVIIFVYTCSILIVLLSKCSKYKECEACFIEKASYIIIFTLYTFVIPMVIMIFSTIILLRRLYEYRTRLNKRRRWIRLKRMFYQSLIYLGWYCLSYWPHTIYSILIVYDSNRFDSLILKSTLHLISTYGIQALPVLTYFTFKPNKKQTQEKYVTGNKIEINMIMQQKTTSEWLKNKNEPSIIEKF
ncbi:unnamed protein product [Rotaria sp. Silwood2]|nr:unnamed protein product [Rotaria sp. Silwood2]CAF2668088.1 unnamed protein product [Rotaria sp. Silwood2]CAF2940666.1 unnamed protein product [Rotaria sp. Silwood2]CAF3089830.1 unnamed protein product [Rotaria sp. Silwood2]CAF3871845.1 unnamed protein product [Rotaria sp. Silwood2]